MSEDLRIAHITRAPKKQEHKPVDFHDRAKLLEANDADEALTFEVSELVNQALLRVSLLFSSMYLATTQKLYWFIPTAAIDTLAVAATGDGACMMMYNVKFVKSLSNVDDVLFTVLHELTHLFVKDLCYAPDLMKDQTFILAQEICNNHFCLTRLGRKNLPTQDKVDPTTGKVTRESVGIDPHKLYREYAKAVEDAVSYETFVSTPMRCYSEMKRMPNPPGEGKKYQVCVHQGGSQPGDDCGDGQGLPSDSDTISSVVKGALEQAMQDALKGDSRAREELLALAGITEGSEKASKMWGDLGLGALRGETVKTRKVEWWSRWLRRVLGSKLTHGGKLIYPRKRAGILSLLGYDSPMLHRGPEKTKRVVRAIDTSGSMSQEFLNRFFKITGQTVGVEWVDLSFDAVVMPYQAGERVYGGGGTSFKIVQDYVEGNLEVNGKKFDGRYDAVLMVTDGYAPHITPKEPGKWIWLVTEDGDMWMDGKMLCHRIDLPE